MSTALISFACKSCGRKIRVKQELAGKRAKCPGCAETLQIPKPRSAAAGVPTPTPAQPSAPTDEFGLDGLAREDDFFAGADQAARSRSNPLGNHVVADPGFGIAESEGDLGEVVSEENAYARNPVIVKMEAEQEKAKKQQETLKGLEKPAAPPNPLTSPSVLLGLMYGIGIFAGFATILVNSGGIGALICFCLGLTGGPVGMGLQIWGLILVNNNEKEGAGMQILLFLLVPFYNIIYTIQNWRAMKGYFAALCVTTIGVTLSFIMMVVIGVIAATNQG